MMRGHSPPSALNAADISPFSRFSSAFLRLAFSRRRMTPATNAGTPSFLISPHRSRLQPIIRRLAPLNTRPVPLAENARWLFLTISLQDGCCQGRCY